MLWDAFAHHQLLQVSKLSAKWVQPGNSASRRKRRQRRASLIAVTKDVVPTGLIRDGWHYHRELLTESETLAL